MSTIDEPLEADLRDAYERRDPGPAPTRLRASLAAVPSSSPGGRSWVERFLGIARPVVAVVATAAAVVVVLLIVSVLRASPGAPVTLQPDGGSVGATPVPDLGAVGEPLAIPIDILVASVLLILLVALTTVELLMQAPVQTASVREPRRGIRRIGDRRPRRTLFVGLAAALLLGGVAVANDRSLGPGSFFSASLVHLEGMGPLNGSGAAGNGQAAYFRYVPGGTVTALQTVRNDGRFPLTIMGGTDTVAGLELRLLARHEPSAAIDVDATPTFPFVPIELAPGEERELVVVVHFGACPGVPIPSSEPSPDLSGTFVPPAPGPSAFESFDAIPLRYSVLGLDRVTDVPLFATLLVRSPSGTICGTDPGWASPSPSAP